MPSKLNSIVIAQAIVSPTNGTFPVRLINLSDLPVALYKIGMLEDINRIGIATVFADTVKNVQSKQNHNTANKLSTLAIKSIYYHNTPT